MCIDLKRTEKQVLERGSSVIDYYQYFCAVHNKLVHCVHMYIMYCIYGLRLPFYFFRSGKPCSVKGLGFEGTGSKGFVT